MQAAVTAALYDLAVAQGDIAIAFAGEEKLAFELIEALKAKIDGRVSMLAPKFNQDTADAIGKIMLQAEVDGLSPQQIKAQITQAYQEYKGYRAERLGRTESIYTANQATIEGYRQVGYITHKEWFANPGACEFCRALDGKVVSLDSNYAELGATLEGDDGGTYAVDYDAINGPPSHPNCTCTTIPVIDKG